MAAQDNQLAGEWYCWHWYPNKQDAGEDITKNKMKAYQQGEDLVLESEPNHEGSYMFIRLAVADNIATGTWQETTSPTGEFAQAMYSGAGQMVIDDDRQNMKGKWVGAGLDRKLGKQRVYTGRWALSREEHTYDQ